MTVCDRLIQKSREAFLMAIEIYNKPSIKYRLEGFSLFVCNAWELMLKAHLIKTRGESSIYYPDKPSRTITLENCIQRVFTNSKAPLRMNLSKIVELRNTSTHFITEEYEMVYVPLLQACVFNFVEKMEEFHGIDMTKSVPQNFINLTVALKSLDEAELRAKYSAQVVDRLIDVNNELTPMIDENNSAFAIRIEHYYYQTKDKSKATELYHIDKNADAAARVIKELKNPNDTHKYTAKTCIKEINNRLNRKNIELQHKGQAVAFNSYHFDMFSKHYSMKENEKFCYIHRAYSQPQYSYSIQAIDFIVDELRKAPDRILDDLKASITNKKC